MNSEGKSIMKKRAAFVFSLTILCGLPARASAESCTEAQAYNKMMALSRAQARFMALGSETIGTEMMMESAGVGQTLADKKYDDACAKYEAIAVKYKIDLKKEALGLVTYEELAKDGGKRGGSCSQAEAHIKMMGMHQQLEDKAALGEVSRDIFTTFGKDTTKLGELMFTDPSEMCKQLDGLKGKYKLN